MASCSSGYESRSHGKPICPILGSIEAIFRPEFLAVTATGEEKDFLDVLPFLGKVNLPTTEQVLKLYMYLRDLPGNYRVPQEEIALQVTKHILVFWKMANYATSYQGYVVKKVLKEVKDYKTMKKTTRNSPKELEEKESYKNRIKKLFNIASSDLEEKLKKDRLLIDKNLPLEKQKLKLAAARCGTKQV